MLSNRCDPYLVSQHLEQHFPPRKSQFHHHVRWLQVRYRDELAGRVQRNNLHDTGPYLCLPGCDLLWLSLTTMSVQLYVSLARHTGLFGRFFTKRLRTRPKRAPSVWCHSSHEFF